MSKQIKYGVSLTPQNHNTITPRKHTMKSILSKTLERCLSVRRPHMGRNVASLAKWLIKQATLRAAPEVDGCGNIHIDLRTTDQHRTLFVAHIDTVHREDGPNKITKTATEWKANGAALGADDGAGVALLMHMIHANVPAYYVFTQGEEVGGIGAKYLEKHHTDLLGEFDRAVAFDRKSIDSVITHQGWGRCCSDAFGEALSTALNDGDATFMYSPDDTGVYTDTAEFVDIIPECTNVSVGYYNEHGPNEKLDLVHFRALAAAVLTIAWDALPTERDPLVKDTWLLDDWKGANDWKDWKNYDWSAYGTTDKPKPKATAINKGDYWGAPMPTVGYVDDTYDDETENYLYECLLDALDGHVTPLVRLIADCVYPEDADQAERLINRNKLTKKNLNKALAMVGKHDADSILCELFDVAYV